MTSTVPWWWLLAGPVIVVLVVLGTAVIAVSSGGGGGHRSGDVGPLQLASVTDDVAGHYRYAESHETAFSAIPCFCGCEEFLAHEHLYDCFVRADGTGYDAHAAGCGVCIAEAALARQLLDAGAPVGEVAARIVERFGTTPTTSPDQTIPRP